jgi:23S rRNA (adenine2503-C2)-methyltransferase
MLIYDLDLPEIVKILISWGEPSYRAMQIWQGLYQNLYSSASQFSNLPKSLREKMSLELGFSELEPVQILDSGDGLTRKTLFKLHDGHLVETVLMRYDKRRTLCISTQVGCAMGCVFCATGQMGFKRNLTCGEIVAQVMYYARELNSEGQRISNIVVMGMGEPFHNYDNTMAAIDRLNNAQGFNLGARRFTISTVGLVPMIKRFSQEKRQINLAISLHAADDSLRLSMLPVNKRYGIDELLEACHEYVENTGRRITFEWALINGVNDTPEQARKLGLRLKGLLCHVNAIPLNPTKGYAGASTTRERALKFKEILENAGIPCTIRIHRGIDIEAGCGQLAERFS